MDKQPEGMTHNNQLGSALVIIVSFLQVAYPLKYPSTACLTFTWVDLCTVESFLWECPPCPYWNYMYLIYVTSLFHQINIYSMWKQSHLVSSSSIPTINHQLVSYTDFYHQHRMLLGVAEGVSELVPEKALPFEFNLDHMNGGMY